LAGEKFLGVLGGVGPLATVYFTQLLVNMTDAQEDQGHISCLIFNHAAIPDRTDYIIDPSKPNPLPVMMEDAKLLEKFGADMIVIPCNTAHYFYEQIQGSVSIPIVNIIEETVHFAAQQVPGLTKLGILATKGTLQAGSYQKACAKFGIDCAIPCPADEGALMDIIYHQVKAGRNVDFDAFLRIADAMRGSGCEALVLGCTELSIIRSDFSLRRADIIDSMEVLARVSIERCGKKIREI